MSESSIVLTSQIEVDRLRAENALLREEIRLREESQIPMIPRAAQTQLDRLRAEVARLEAERDDWKETAGRWRRDNDVLAVRIDELQAAVTSAKAKP